MSIIMQINPFDFFTDANGDALDSGFIYVGEPNKDPRQFPVAAFYDSALTIPAAMPLRTSNGYIVRNGSPTFLYINGNYSILVQDKKHRQIYYVADFLMISSGSAVSAGDLANNIDPAKGSALVGYKSPLPGSVGRTVSSKLGDIISAKDFGAVGDGIADDTVAVQTLIDVVSASGGGAIYFPTGIYKLNVILKPYVSLIGCTFGATRGVIDFGATITHFATVFTPAVSGWIIDTPGVGGAIASGILGIDFKGGGLTTPGGGVNLRTGSNDMIVRSCKFEFFADEALVTNALIGHFCDLSGTNCLLNRVRASRTGVFQFNGADNFIERIQGNTGITGIVSASLFLCAIFIGGANNYAVNLEGELSEIGILTTSSGAIHKLANCRADLNYGPGFQGAAMYANCHSLNNSNGDPGVYSGFAGSVNAQYTGCRADGAHKYGLDVGSVEFSLLSQRPNIDNFVSSGHVVGSINYPTTNGAVVGLKGAHLRNVSAAGDISVSDGVNSIRFNHAVSSEITSFTDGHLGQVVYVTAGNANTVFVRSSAFVVQGVDSTARKTLIANRPYFFMLGQTGWTEITDTYIIPVVTTATRPNAFSNPGLTVFDSTLNKPIWRNPANNGWVDATGTSV